MIIDDGKSVVFKMKQDPIIMGDIDIVAKLMDNNNCLD
jgi:hypothetical protein